MHSIVLQQHPMHKFVLAPATPHLTHPTAPFDIAAPLLRPPPGPAVPCCPLWQLHPSSFAASLLQLAPSCAKTSDCKAGFFCGSGKCTVRSNKPTKQAVPLPGAAKAQSFRLQQAVPMCVTCLRQMSYFPAVPICASHLLGAHRPSGILVPPAIPAMSAPAVFAWAKCVW